MTKKMLINAVDSEEYRIAVLNDGLLDGFHIDTSKSEQKEGNIYKGIIERLEPNLQACFVNYGGARNGFLSIDDVHPEYFHENEEASKGQPFPPIEKVLKKGQELLVEVTKEMPGKKGAQLTTYISIAGRYLVLTPGRTIRGISRKIEDEEERQRLKKVIGQLKIPDEIGYIVRTVASGKSKRELSKDLNRLLRLWKNIREKVTKSPALSLIHKEQDLCLKTIRDTYSSDISEVVVDDKETFNKIKEYMEIISPRDHKKVKLYKEKRPIFDHYSIETQIESIYRKQVPLKSGGSIVFDTTEALISIDVNSGRGFKGKDVESMVFRTNMEAAVEITRQLRLRDLGGLIVIDFIDMKERKHIRDVEKALREELKKDRAKTDTSNISKFGIMELSRQRLNPSIESKSYKICEHCQGRGLVISVEAAAISFLRRIWMGISKGNIVQVQGKLPSEVADYIQNKKRHELADLEARYKTNIVIVSDHTMTPGGGKLEFKKET
ncbi:MAG: Rne/Rng family ribonuclease [Deltaproteobacteria bacterium]|nr:Rne/Rng family ribonuclease [Deltaproteobacteria bacterium]